MRLVLQNNLMFSDLSNTRVNEFDVPPKPPLLQSEEPRLIENANPMRTDALLKHYLVKNNH